VGYALPPLAGLEKEKEKPPLHYKGWGIREGNVKDSQRQLLNQEGFIAQKANDGKAYFAALGMTA
jgi:hypothetical protein